MQSKNPRYVGDRTPTMIRIPVAEKKLLDERTAASGLTFSQYIAELIRRDDVDADGIPVWVPIDRRPAQERLIA